jgi:glycosyltransferase involved in cell wall biosynthesis
MNTAGLQTDRDRAHWNALLSTAAKDRRIRIIDRRLNYAELGALYDACDCYVSLHRSEGFGFGPAEAMARGKPAMVTAYSGVTDFCTPETALLVDYRLRPLEPGLYPYMDPQRTYYWAHPDLEAASRTMRELVRAPETGAAVGRRAAALMAQRYSVSALSARYRARLAELHQL